MQEIVGASAPKADEVEYQGWKKTFRICNDTVQLIIVTEVGPRILFFGFRGEHNELHEVPEHAGKSGDGVFRVYGGHRLWVSPEVERTYYPDNAQVSVRKNEDAFIFTAPPESAHPGTNLQKEVEVKLAGTGAHVSVIHRISNLGKEATEMAPWALSVMAGGGKAILPLPPRAPVAADRLLPEGVLALWCYTDLADPRWKIGTKYVQLQQQQNPAFKFKEQMTGLYNPFGWGAYFRQGHLFVKRAAVHKRAKYPDFGCNFEHIRTHTRSNWRPLGHFKIWNPG